MYKLLAILFEIDNFLSPINMDKESSKSSLSRIVIFFPKVMPFLSKNCKNSDDESSTPIQIPLSFLDNVDNKLFSTIFKFPSLSGIGSP